MELPNVDNDFISLFIPETSCFPMEDLLEEFKIYVFKIMNISIDMIFQEQINNEFENTILTKNLKAYFYEKFDNVSEINSIYNTSLKKVNNIKNLLENNKIIVEKNLDKLQVEANLKELNQIFAHITLNKSFSNKNQVIVDLINIPFILINLLKQNNLELFIQYINYVEKIEEQKKSKIIEIIKHTVSVIKFVAKRYFLNNLRMGHHIYDSLMVNEIINIPFYDCISNIIGDQNRSQLIALNINLYTYELFRQDHKSLSKGNEPKDYVNNLVKNVEKHFNEIVLLIREINEMSCDCKENLLISILDNHLFDSNILKDLFFSVDEFQFNRELISHLLKYIDETTNSNLQILLLAKSNTVNKIEEIAKILFDKFIENIINKVKFNVEKFLSERDIGNILKYSDTKENSLKFEILVIISYNIGVVIDNILEFGAYYNFYQKINFLEITDRLILDLILIIKKQFESKFIFAKDKKTITTFKEFLDVLINIVLENNLSNLYRELKLLKLWENIDKCQKVKKNLI